MNDFDVEINYTVEGGTPGGITGHKRLSNMSDIIEEVITFLKSVGIPDDLDCKITIEITREGE